MGIFRETSLRTRTIDSSCSLSCLLSSTSMGRMLMEMMTKTVMMNWRWTKRKKGVAVGTKRAVGTMMSRVCRHCTTTPNYWMKKMETTMKQGEGEQEGDDSLDEEED